MKTYYKAFWLFGLCVILISSLASASPQDSLRQILRNVPIDDYEQLVDLNNALAWSYRDIRPDSSLYFANLAQRMAKDFGLKKQEVQSINYVGVAYRNLSNFSKAFEKYLEALKLAEETGNSEQRGYSLINLGNLYLYQTNYQGAIKYFIQALDQAQSLADKRMVGYCFLNLGRSYKGISEFGQAELYFTQSIQIRKDLGDVYGSFAAEIDLAEVYLLEGDLKKAERFHLDLISRLEGVNNPRLLAVVYNNMARIALNMGKIGQAENYAMKAIEITRDVNSRYEEKNVLETLSKIYATSDDFEKAYANLGRFADLNQQLFSEENIRRIEQMKSQYEMEKQEVENQFLRKQTELSEKIISTQRILIAASVIGVLLFLSITVVSVRGYNEKKRLNKEISEQRDKIAADKELIQKQSDKLIELDQAKSRFFANVSHDLRSPLSLIIGNLEMLKEDEDVVLTAGAIRNLETAHKNCKRLLYLTDEINDLTRLEEGKVNLKPEVVKVGSYLQLLTDMFVGTAQYKGVKLSCENAVSKDEVVFIDPRQFEKIYYNLVSNAIRHTSRGDKITIETHQDGEQIVISVKDTGEGISSESLPHIFDRFYQSKNNEYRSREGLGIGLALVKELVELHKGTITVESTLGLGTCFKIKLPKVSSADVEGIMPVSFTYVAERKHLYDDLDRNDSAGANLPKLDEMMSIMIVDDHPEIRYHIRQILEEEYHVIEAAHGVEALELLKTNEVSLIVTDLMMPWMDGFEFIEALQSKDEYKKIPILVVSARVTDTDQEKVLSQGVNDYLQKPFQKKEMLQRISNLINRSKESQTDVFAELADKSQLDNSEKAVLDRLEKIVIEKIGDENLSVYDIADALAASERQVYRLVKKITGLTPHEYVSEVRLKYADFLIRKGKVKSATDAAKSIGLKNVTVFSNQYEKKFGVKPTELLKS